MAAWGSLPRCVRRLACSGVLQRLSYGEIVAQCCSSDKTITDEHNHSCQSASRLAKARCKSQAVIASVLQDASSPFAAPLLTTYRLHSSSERDSGTAPSALRYKRNPLPIKREGEQPETVAPRAHAHKRARATKTHQKDGRHTSTTSGRHDDPRLPRGPQRSSRRRCARSSRDFERPGRDVARRRLARVPTRASRGCAPTCARPCSLCWTRPRARA